MSTTRAQLDAKTRAGCQVQGCTHRHNEDPLYIHAFCHPFGRLAVRYFDGVMSVECRECGARVVSVGVQG